MSGNLRGSSPFWSRDENKAFENAIATHFYDEHRLVKVAAAVPRRTLEEVETHFNALVSDVQAIECGEVPVPHYVDSSLECNKLAAHASSDRKGKQLKTKEYEDESRHRGEAAVSMCFGIRKRSKPWTDDEHSLFIQGLEKCGRGHWSIISRQFVKTRTPAQVASHAQKYLRRMGLSGRQTPGVGQSSGSGNAGLNITVSQPLPAEEKNEAENFEELLRTQYNAPGYEIFDEELMPVVDNAEVESVYKGPPPPPGYQSCSDPEEVAVGQMLASPARDTTTLVSLFPNPPPAAAPKPLPVFPTQPFTGNLAQAGAMADSFFL